MKTVAVKRVTDKDTLSIEYRFMLSRREMSGLEQHMLARAMQHGSWVCSGPDYLVSTQPGVTES